MQTSSKAIKRRHFAREKVDEKLQTNRKTKHTLYMFSNVSSTNSFNQNQRYKMLSNAKAVNACVWWNDGRGECHVKIKNKQKKDPELAFVYFD